MRGWGRDCLGHSRSASNLARHDTRAGTESFDTQSGLADDDSAHVQAAFYLHEMGGSKKTSEPDDGEPDVETLQLTQTLLRRTFRERFSRGEHRQEQERLMDIDPLLVTHTQSTKLVQPSESSLYLRLASIGMMWRARRPSGRWRGRLRSPCNGGMESTS